MTLDPSNLEKTESEISGSVRTSRAILSNSVVMPLSWRIVLIPQSRLLPRRPRKEEMIWVAMVIRRLTPSMTTAKAMIVSSRSSVICGNLLSAATGPRNCGARGAIAGIARPSNPLFPVGHDVALPVRAIIASADKAHPGVPFHLPQHGERVVQIVGQEQGAVAILDAPPQCVGVHRSHIHWIVGDRIHLGERLERKAAATRPVLHDVVDAVRSRVVPADEALSRVPVCDAHPVPRVLFVVEHLHAGAAAR